MGPRTVGASLTVIVGSLLLGGLGLDALRFDRIESAAMDVSTSLEKETPDSRQRKVDAVLATLAPWLSRDGFATRAQRARGALLAKTDSPVRMEQAVSDLLAVEPTAGRQWLELARLRWRRAAPIADTLDALQMSTVTEPHEALTMLARAPFMLTLWEFLPDAEKRFTINQLIELDGRFDAQTRQELRTVIASKADATREALKNALSTRGVGDASWAHDIGL